MRPVTCSLQSNRKRILTYILVINANSSVPQRARIIELLEENRVLREHHALAKETSRLHAIFDATILNDQGEVLGALRDWAPLQ